MNKKKIFNDPVYGFITIPCEIIFDLIEHPWFQRLRRIRQLGLTHLVYPGAIHTRLHHALGALHLMTQAVDTIRSKGHEISDKEAEAVYCAILLHDIGHAPFSHALEHTLIHSGSHEQISLAFMELLNEQFEGKLSTCIDIFTNRYPKQFLHQLVSSQLDMDRVDYLNRDSFYTGVLEGTIGAQRIIKMLEVHNDELVIEEKGIYSIEKFIIARRLMYWQVYLHKTVLGAEQLLIRIIQRAKELCNSGCKLFASPALQHFLHHEFNLKNGARDRKTLELFARIDDYDIYNSVKVWADESDIVLSRLCSGLINRRLYKIRISKEPFDVQAVEEKKKECVSRFGIKEEDAGYFAFTGTISNNAYDPKDEQIRIIYKDGTLKELTEVSDQMDIAILSRPVQKHFLCYLEELA
jgi:uncharacterized protein